MELLSLEEAVALDRKRANTLFEKHINPGLLNIYKILGLDEMDVQRAEGMEIHLRDGTIVLDFTSALGILALGHNHPRILAAEEYCKNHLVLDALKVAPHKLQSALAFNLSQIMPDPLQFVFFAVSGAEAVEAALKLCERAQRGTKNKFITTSGSYHGRTHGTLTVSRSGKFREGFILSIPEENALEIPYGDLNALQEAIEKNKTDRKKNAIIALILEPLQGQGIVNPPPGYLREVVRICHDNNILVIFDEIKTGMCRTGSFCAFFDEDVVPDVVTLSKALGGGRRAISATITSQKIFKRAYGTRESCTLHGTTFGGLGSSCAVAIETLNIMCSSGFQEAVRSKGDYFIARLKYLKEKYPEQISEIRGKGLLLGIKFVFEKSFLSKFLKISKLKYSNTLDSLLIASIVHEFYKEHKMLVHFSATDPDILHIMPPLIIEKGQIDALVDSMDKILSKGLLKVLSKFVTDNVRGFL